MTNDVRGSQWDSLKHFTGSFFLTDDNYIRNKFYVHSVAFKIKRKLTF